MDKHQLSHLLHIQQASKEDKLVLFVGAGVSANSGVPMWSKLIDLMKKELTTNETDYLKIAQLYKDARGSKECIDKVKEVLRYNKVHPTAIHEHLLSLKPCHIITTNYDKVNIDWILDYTQDISKRKEFFKNKTYRSKLKDYIKDYMGSKEIRNELIDLL